MDLRRAVGHGSEVVVCSVGDAGHRVRFAEEAAPVVVLQVEDRVERPVEVIREPGRLPEDLLGETAESFPQATVLDLGQVDLELVRAVRARDHPHRLAVGVDPLVETLEVVEVRREQVLDHVGGDLVYSPILVIVRASRSTDR